MQFDDVPSSELSDPRSNVVSIRSCGLLRLAVIAAGAKVAVVVVVVVVVFACFSGEETVETTSITSSFRATEAGGGETFLAEVKDTTVS